MLLKQADDKSRRLALLEDLQQSSLLDARQKRWLREELLRCRKGIQGERESAHHLDSYFKGRDTHVLIHDLRLVVDGDVAQIDHLLINRAGHFYLIETKNYAGHVSVNAHGEFTVRYDQDCYGVPSPLEQSHRHERILLRLLERLDIAPRTDKQPPVHHLVMMHPKAIIQRPDSREFDTSFLIKADQFPSWHKQFIDGTGVGAAFMLLANLRSQETIRGWGEKLLRQHRPDDLLALPEFMRPCAVAQAEARETATAAKQVPAVAPLREAPARVEAQSADSAKKLVCARCGAKISFAEGRFCWGRPQRFGGLQYCREHQALFD